MRIKNLRVTTFLASLFATLKPARKRPRPSAYHPLVIVGLTANLRTCIEWPSSVFRIVVYFYNLVHVIIHMDGLRGAPNRYQFIGKST